MKINKALILAISEESILDAEKMLLEAGFEWNSHPFNFKNIVKECAAILVGWEEVSKGKIIYISRIGGPLRNEHNWTVYLSDALTPEIIQTFDGAKPIKKSIPINAKWLLNGDACDEGFKWFVKTYGKSTVDSNTVLEALKDSCLMDWHEWLNARI